ncbi:MAG: hypothetical protein PHI02_02710 [Sulfurovaceae bacterium]|nr:hypothetical protein [Sulfurovaceae bacterium]
MRKILFIFVMLGLVACSSEKNQYQKGENVMLDEIFYSKISADPVHKMQKNRADINAIVLKYFKIGEPKQEVVLRLQKIGFKMGKETNDGIYAFAIKPKVATFDLTPVRLVIFFEFDDNKELSDIKSSYFFESI